MIGGNGDLLALGANSGGAEVLARTGNRDREKLRDRSVGAPILGGWGETPQVPRAVNTYSDDPEFTSAGWWQATRYPSGHASASRQLINANSGAWRKWARKTDAAASRIDQEGMAALGKCVHWVDAGDA